MRVVVVVAAVLMVAACSPEPPPAPRPEPERTPGPTRTSEPGPSCSPDGIALSAGPVEAALGHRGVVVTMTNCGQGTVRADGYPGVTVLDSARAPMPITVEHGPSYMARDPGPHPHEIEPGEQLLTVLSWSNTVTSGDKATGAFVTLTPLPGGTPQTVPVETDLGTTGTVTVTAWAPELLH